MFSFFLNLINHIVSYPLVSKFIRFYFPTSFFYSEHSPSF